MLDPRVNPRSPERRAVGRRDAGSAMIITLMVTTLVVALTATMTTVSINGMQAARSARQVGLALNAAEVGVARALTYLRTEGAIAKVNLCAPPSPGDASCTGFAWDSAPDSPSVPVGELEGHAYRAWIETITPFLANQSGRYVIHSTGMASGEAAQAVEVNVEIFDSELPKGIVADTIWGGGTSHEPKITGMSVLSSGCVYSRDKVTIASDAEHAPDPGHPDYAEAVEDLAYGIPAAVHAWQITVAPRECTDTNALHSPTDPCDDNYPFDQSGRGGNFPIPSTCLTNLETFDGAPTAAWREYYAQGSRLASQESIFSTFGTRPSPSVELLSRLKDLAKGQGRYYWNTTTYPRLDAPATAPGTSVIYFDFPPTSPRPDVNLREIFGFNRAACESGKSLIVVIQGGDATLTANTSREELSATLIVDGHVQNTGTPYFIGTIHANSIFITGDVDLTMEQCFLNSRSAALLDVRVTNYREVEPPVGP